MAKDLLHILESIGLDTKEAQLYLTGLQLGTAPASDYAKAAGINRVTAYNTLEELVQKGICTKVKKVRASGTRRWRRSIWRWRREKAPRRWTECSRASLAAGREISKAARALLRGMGRSEARL